MSCRDCAGVVKLLESEGGARDQKQEG